MVDDGRMYTRPYLILSLICNALKSLCKDLLFGFSTFCTWFYVFTMSYIEVCVLQEDKGVLEENEVN